MFMCPSVKANHSITATWCLPSMDAHYRTKPEEYVSHLVGHEGTGSLLAALKQLGCDPTSSGPDTLLQGFRSLGF